MGVIMQHLRHFSMLGINKSQFNSQLASVTNTQTQGVFAFIEILQSLSCFFIEFESAGPPLGRTQHVRIRESSDKDNHIYLFESFTSADQIGHVYILHVKTGQMQSPGRFTLTLAPFLPDHSSPDTRFSSTVQLQAQISQFAGKTLWEFIFQLIVFIALVSLQCLLFATLTPVE